MPNVEVSRIIIKHENQRASMDQGKLKELADSIREMGILQPLVCREVNGMFELIAGNRRFAAAKLVGLREVPIVLRDTKEEDIQFDQVIENLQREDLNAEEKFQAFKKMREQGLNVGQISKKTGVNTTVISTILGLEELDQNIRKRDDIEEYAKQLIAKAPKFIQGILADRNANGELVTRCLLADVLPAIKSVRSEPMFSEEEKKRIIERIALETVFHEYPAKSILNQELGKKKLEKSGIMPKVISNNTLEDYIKKCKMFTEVLFDIQSTHLQYLDKGLVIRLYAQLNDVKNQIDSLIPKTGGKGVKKES